ncbi:hypothetical protein [Streptomyces sp. NPDC054838]
MRTGTRRAAALTLCGALAAVALNGCGGQDREGYVAVGAAAAGPGENVPPPGEVEFQQLGAPPVDGGAASAPSGTSPGAGDSQTPAGSARGGATSSSPGGSAPPGIPPDPAPAATTPGTPHIPEAPGSPAPPGSTPPATPGRPGTPAPATPARLTLGAPLRSAAADRWCERVTVGFTNTGTAAARSGTVSFATHIIGALGLDWATITTTQPLPAPIAGGTTKTQTYPVCVESWRVPLGMHVETRTVTAGWS